MADELAADSFLNLLGQSDLLSDEQLLALMAEFRGDGKWAESAQKLADELVTRQILTTWQAEMLLQRKHRGFRLGTYRILRPLGQGGMSKVFLAEHEVMRRRCAIKVLPSKYQEDADFLTRFRLEAVAIARLDHPNIVRAYDFNKDFRYGKEIHYLVMEYVEGPDLRRLVEEQGPLDCRKAADFMSQAAEGLAHAHAAGFVHRDIKPANLLVDPHGVLKVLDLGLATFTFAADQALNPDESEESAVGTADYVAPEQVMDSRNVDGRADIYSLGHTFYFLLTGHRPFSKPTIMELLMAHRTEKPEPIGKFRPDVPFDLEAIIDKMTAKSPLHRYQSAKELAEKLRTWLRESGSARSYSRISALMAEALRAKQPSGDAGGGATAKRAEQSELELATLDDGSAAAKASGTAQSESAKLRAAQAKDKDRPTGASGRLAPEVKKPAAGAAVGAGSSGRLSGGDRNAITPPAVPASSLPGLAGADLMSELPPADSLPKLPTRSGPHPHVAHPRSRKPGRLREILKSPWTWVGLAGLVFLVVITFLLFQVSSLPSQKPSRAVDKTTAGRTKQGAGRASSAGPKQTTQKTTPTTGSVLPETSKSKSSLKSEQKPVPQPVKKVEPSKPVKVEPKPVTPQPTPTPPPDTVKPPEPAPTPTPSASEAKPPEAVPPPEDKAKLDRLLAGLQTLSVHVQSVDNISSSALDKAIRTQVERSAERATIKVVDKDPAVMEVELKMTTSKDAFSIVMSAELKCPDENGKVVTVWKKSEQVHRGVLRNLRTEMLSRVLLTPVAKFFSQLPNDVRKARKDYPEELPY